MNEGHLIVRCEDGERHAIPLLIDTDAQSDFNKALCDLPMLQRYFDSGFNVWQV